MGIDLDRIRIAAPCEARWSEMEGTEQRRFCAECKLHVYDFRTLSREEIASLIENTEGRLCARLYQRKDGTLITRDCPRGRKRVLQKRVGFAAFFAAASAMVFAASPRRPDPTERPPVGAAPQYAEEMRDWPVVGYVVEKLWPRPILMGEIAVPTPPPTSSKP